MPHPPTLIPPTFNWFSVPFTTLRFIAFFAIVFFGYYAVSHRFRWWLLLAASWVFYGWMSPYYLIFLAFVTTATYFAAVGMDGNYRREREWISVHGKGASRDEKKVYKAGMEGRRRWMSFGAIAALLSLLLVFKYLEFLFVNVAWLGGVIGLKWHPPALNMILPVGLSFYVFQSMAYVIDVQRGEMPAERNFFRHTLYVSYFPQIMQGPIGNYGRLAHQLFEEHAFDYEQVVFGLQRVAWGFFKKLCVANMIAYRINPVWASCGEYPGFLFWMTMAFLYAIQLYADFSGYMDIACGCSQMLGIKLDENFNCPYFSKSVSEYWRRWHISLSSWFKDYLFYPVLRSEWNASLRKRFANKYLASAVPTSVALAIVWAATGLWHGACWGYVAWGVYYGLFMILGVLLAPVYDRFHARFPRLVASRSYAAFQMLRTFVIVMLGYLIFKPADLGATKSILGTMLTDVGSGALQGFLASHMKWLSLTIALCGIVLVIDVIHLRFGEGLIRKTIRKFPLPIRWGVYVGGVWVLLYLMRSDIQTFEYFRF